MLKKIILAIATFAIIAIAFMVVQWQENLSRPNHAVQKQELPPRRPPQQIAASSQPDQPANPQTLSFGQASIPPGEAPKIHRYDRQGNAKIIFGAESWRPISDTEFDLTKPKARLLLPRGQVAYVQADAGRVEMRKGDSSTKLDPHRGQFEGHVNIIIDRTDIEWRKDHPDRVAPEQHSEKVIKIWLEDVEFDLDFNWLKSTGAVTIQSKEGTLEGTGLSLHWDEMDRKVREVTIHHGKRARLRLAGLMNFQSIDTESTDQTNNQNSETQSEEDLAEEPLPEYPFAFAETDQDQQNAASTTEQADEHTKNLLEMAQLKKQKPPSIKTYQIAFQDRVVVEHIKGVQVIKRLSADLLKLTRDFSSSELNPGGIRRTSPSTSKPSATDQDESGDEHENQPKQNTQDQYLEVCWTGPLTIKPVKEQKKEDTKQKDTKSKGQKLHLLATGSPVELFDRQKGSARCLELEYHEKDRKVWLRGGPKQPVIMQRGEGRRLTGGELFLDPQQGIVRMTGAGSLVDRGEKASPPDQSAETKPAGNMLQDNTRDQVKISWQQSIELEFEQGQKQKQDSKGNLADMSAMPEITRVRRAIVKGAPSFENGDQSITATDFIDVTFPPQAKLDSINNVDQVVADKIIAQGQVRMTDEQDTITCDRLEVDMTVNAAGKNVPEQGRAFGNTRVYLANANGRIKMQADNELIASFKSIPQKDKGNSTNGSSTSENRWGVVISDLKASGQVKVESLEDKLLSKEKELDLSAEELECSFTDDNRIERALVFGNPDTPAEVDTGDFFIRGQRIRLNVPEESAEVPGQGILRLYSRQDLDGRAAKKPIPITISWQERMELDGKENIGIFSGSAHAISQNIITDCDELRVEFAELVPASPQATAAETPVRQQLALATGAIAANLPGSLTLSNTALIPSVWKMGRMAASLAGAARDAKETGQGSRVATRIRKRPVYIKAVGNAKVVSRNMREAEPKTKSGAVSRMLANTFPQDKTPTTRPEKKQHTESIVRVTGPMIAINLKPLEEYFTVEGAGNLLIVDHRIPDINKQSRRSGLGGIQNSLEPMAFGASGPSHTLFKWQNSMTYLNNHNTAVFDHHVNMIHRSGSEMVLLDKILASTDLKKEQFEGIESHKVDLDCENFYVEFQRDGDENRLGSTPLSQVAMLDSFRAVGRVRLQMDNRHAEGESIYYDNARGIALLDGSAQNPPQIMEYNPDTGRVIPWTGKSLQWNLKTKKIRVFDSSMQATTD